MQNPRCDNIRDAHDAQIIGEDNNAILWYCSLCGHEGAIFKDERGVPHKQQFHDVFKRWTLQGNDPLFYKYYPKFLKT